MNRSPQHSWNKADWFVVSLRIFGFIISLASLFQENIGGHQGMVLTMGLLSLAVPQLFFLPGYFKPRWFITMEILFSGGYTIYLATLTAEATSYFLLPLFVISYLCTKRTYTIIAPICLGLLPAVFGTLVELPLESIINLFINMALFSALGLIFGVFVRQQDQLAAALRFIEEKNSTLEHSLQQIERMTILEERNRMSRELHDTVGHSLTASIVAMEAVQTLMERDPQAAKERLLQLITFNRNQLDTFRQTVHDMAMNELKLPLSELLARATESFAEQTGTKVHLETENSLAGLHVPEAVKLSLLRCLQETLTNAKRHGNATEVQIRLTFKEKELGLWMQDNGTGFGDLQEGFGVEGMKERVEALRGTFQIASKEGSGTVVICNIPMGAS